MRRTILLVLVLSLVLGISFWVLKSRLGQTGSQPTGPVEINFWGIGEEEAVMRPLIENYQNTHPDIKINYNKQTLLNYRPRVQTQMRSEGGPDIVEIHNSWTSMFSSDLAPLPGTFMSADDFSKTFYPSAKDSLSLGSKIYGLPLEVDGLALYYNEEILQAAGVKVPNTWQDFINAARQVTVRSTDGQIQTAGAAIGATANIDFWPEILGLLFLQQPSGDLTKPANPNGAEVLQFYTSFITDPKNKTWDVTLPSSTQMFSDGKLAFYFGPLRQAQIFQTNNPNLRFKITTVPQLPGRSLTWGSFWAVGVSIRSKHQNEAWDFLKYLTSPESLQLLYQGQGQNRVRGRIFPRIDMIGLLSNDPVAAPFLAQAPYAKNWYLNSNTQDQGINESMIKYYEAAVNGVLAGLDPLGTLQEAQVGIQNTILEYTNPRSTPSTR